MVGAGKDLVLGYDFGTSSVKAALFDRAGRPVASGSVGYPLLLPARGWAEQNPEDWWSAMREVTARLLAETPGGAARIAAIGMAAQMCGVVPVAADGTALHNGLIWLDTRSEAIARRAFGGRIRLGGYSPLALYRWLRLTGGAPNLSGKDPISKILWLREQRPELWPRIHKLLDVKDFLLHRCTGRFATTPDCAHLTWLFDARPGRKCWSPEILRRLGLDAALLPEIRRCTDAAGALHRDAAALLGLDAGTPVAAGLGDVSAFALAAGNRGAGALHLCLGTGGWIGAHLSRSKVDVFTRVGSICSADAGDYLLIAAQESVGACVGWAARALAVGAEGSPDFAAFERLAAQAPKSPDAPYFFPWLYGERVPIDDQRVRGGFANLSIQHGRAEVARAVLEGVALNLRWALGAMERITGRAATPIRILGAGAGNDFWCQLIADVVQRPLERVALPQLGGALGAAMTAAIVAGWHGDLAGAAAMTEVERSFVPDPLSATYYAARFRHFVACYRRMRPWYRRLAPST